MEKIFVTLKQAFKQLNPKMALESAGVVRKVKEWPKYLKGYLDWDAKVKSDIYNNGKIEVNAFKENPNMKGCNRYLIFKQFPVRKR